MVVTGELVAGGQNRDNHFLRLSGERLQEGKGKTMTTCSPKTLIAGGCVGVSPLIAGTLVLATLTWPTPAAADPTLEFLKGTPVQIQFYYDLANSKGFKVADRLITVPGGSDAEDLAKAVADDLNHLTPGSAILNGKEVTFVGYSKASFTEVGRDNPIDYWKLHNPSSTDTGSEMNFLPSKETGFDRLTSNGSFSLSGPGGLDVSFTAAIGTTGDALASELANLINAQNPSFAATAGGTSVHFTNRANGVTTFGANGTGIDYQLGSPAPEPSSALLAALGTAILLGAWRTASTAERKRTRIARRAS
jgi:hypothetical protein